MTAAIVGIGRTPFTRDADLSAAALAARAIAGALHDARLDLADVEGIVRFDREALWEYDLPGVMRLRALTYYGALPDCAGSAPALVRLAALAVDAGMARVVLGYHARAAARPAPAPETLAAAGISGAPAPLATQGGCAFVVSTHDGVPARAVAILGSMQAAIPGAERHPEAWLACRRDGVVRTAARRLLGSARVEVGRIDVACLYAHPPGLANLSVADFEIDRSRSVINPHAGGPDAGELDGADDLLEAIRQLRGESAQQVAGARVALVAGSPLEPTSAVLLGAPR